MTHLRGVAWNHTRGFVPVVATAQRYEELHPDVTITWEKRSLQAFADEPLDELASRFDLIVMDHPHTALAATQGVLLPLDEWLPADFLQDQADNSVGGSHASYAYAGHQWTLATDAATPIATWRPDLMAARGLELPRTWDDVLCLARGGHVAVSLFPVDVLMHVYMFCEALGHPAFQTPEEFAPREVIEAALGHLRDLAMLVPSESLQRNTIRTAEFMTQTDEASYCPFAYGYSNYSRPRYAPHTLKAGGLVNFNGKRLRSTLGGAGLAISSRTKHPRLAADYAAFTANPETQRGIYYQAGGQPGHRLAWLDDGVNLASNNYFRDTLAALDAALVRPQYPGYMLFQDEGSPVAHDAIAGETPIVEAAQELARIHRISREETV